MSPTSPTSIERWVITAVLRHIPKPTTPEQVVDQLLRDTGSFYPLDMVATVMAETDTQETDPQETDTQETDTERADAEVAR